MSFAARRDRPHPCFWNDVVQFPEHQAIFDAVEVSQQEVVEISELGVLKFERWRQDGPKKAHNGPKKAPRRPQDGPRWPQDGKMAQSWAPRRPKMAKDGPKMAQDGAKMAQDRGR